MRVSDRYIGRQILKATAFAIIFLSVILILGTVLQQIRMLLVDFGAPLSVIGDLILGALPFSLIYTIPWAFLSAVLLVYGRMSRDQELTGFRVAGISLKRISLPVFIIAGVLSALCMWLNTQLSPQAAANVDKIKMKVFLSDPRSILSAAVEQDGLERLESSMRGTKAFIAKADGQLMDGLHIFRTPSRDNPGDRPVYVYAKKARLESDSTRNELRFRLFDAIFATTDENDQPQVVQTGEAVPVVLPYEISSDGRKKPKSMSNDEIREYLGSTEFHTKVPQRLQYKTMLRSLGEIQRRYSSSFACLAFAMVGIPLGIKARRKDTSTGLVLSLLIGTAYFASFSFDGTTMRSVYLVAWAPNVVCLVLGLFLFWRARFR